MQKILAVTATVAALSAFAASPSFAQVTHSLGGPLVEGTSCWKSTNSDLDYGYWTTCPRPAPVVHRKRK